jgi:hypothetical protein
MAIPPAECGTMPLLSQGRSMICVLILELIRRNKPLGHASGMNNGYASD